jgi:FkbM family methyltransferase
MYNSQHLQDKYLNEKVFKNKTNGVFLDIGANDGVAINNTLFFEKELGWNGMCIEPYPIIFEKLKNNRSCICINGCIAKETKKDIFVEIQGYPAMLSGLKSEYNEKHLQRIEYELSVFGGSKKEIEVQCYNINEILALHNMYNIDYCSIDIEGGEFNVLQTIDFNKINIQAFSIENNYHESKFKKFMKTKGYKLIEVLDCDDIYIKI